MRHMIAVLPAPGKKPVESGLFSTWLTLADALSDPAVELTPEEFAAVYSLYKRRKATGESFDPMLEALLSVLARQVEQGDDDDDAGNTDFHAWPADQNPREVQLEGVGHA